MSAQRVLEIAAGEVGYLEKKSNSQLEDKTANAGTNNYTKYGAWYDGGSLQANPWCDMFVSWCGDEAGEGDAVGCFAYCPSHVNWFRNRGQWFPRGAKTPQAGDIIFFATDGVTACHVGIVERVQGSYVHTIEGNTSGGSTLVANGGGVFRKSYPLTSGYILGYGRPAYDSATKTYTLGWHHDGTGWWYAYSATAYYKDQWAKINGLWYCFDTKGYAATNQIVNYKDADYYLGASGAMVTGQTIEIGGVTYYAETDGKLTKIDILEEEDMQTRYVKISEIPSYYRDTVDKLVSKGIILGKEGAGEELVIDLGEDSVRLLVYLDRAKVFG